MTKKYYWAIAVAAAFVAGTMTTGGVVYASFDQCNNEPPMGLSDGKPFLEIWAALCDLETQVNNINVEDDDSDPENELQTISRTDSTVTLSDGGGSVSIADSDSDPTNEIDTWESLEGIPDGFADGIDNVDDADNNPSNEIQTFQSQVITRNLNLGPTVFRDNEIINCPPGWQILGGGYKTPPPGVKINSSFPIGASEAWNVTVEATTTDPVNVRTTEVFAVCGNLTQ